MTCMQKMVEAIKEQAKRASDGNNIELRTLGAAIGNFLATDGLTSSYLRQVRAEISRFGACGAYGKALCDVISAMEGELLKKEEQQILFNEINCIPYGPEILVELSQKIYTLPDLERRINNIFSIGSVATPYIEYMQRLEWLKLVEFNDPYYELTPLGHVMRAKFYETINYKLLI